MFIERNKIALFYEKKGSGPPLILLHGNGEDHFIFDKITDELGKTFTVYSLDTRGHGQSGDVEAYHYQDMADDVVYLIECLGLHRPFLYGFSDGGIVGLMIACQYPSILSRLMVSGANLYPRGLKRYLYWAFKLLNVFKNDPKLELMLTEPAITATNLRQIQIPVHVLAAERDIVRAEHTRFIASSIPDSQLLILAGETHGSYVVHSRKLISIIEEAIES